MSIATAIAHAELNATDQIDVRRLHVHELVSNKLDGLHGLLLLRRVIHIGLSLVSSQSGYHGCWCIAVFIVLAASAFGWHNVMVVIAQQGLVVECLLLAWQLGDVLVSSGVHRHRSGRPLSALCPPSSSLFGACSNSLISGRWLHEERILQSVCVHLLDCYFVAVVVEYALALSWISVHACSSLVVLMARHPVLAPLPLLHGYHQLWLVSDLVEEHHPGVVLICPPVLHGFSLLWRRDVHRDQVWSRELRLFRR